MSRKLSARPASTDVISEMVRRIVERVDPLQVILFGSRARGEARPESDVDLLVVVPDGRDKRQAWHAAYEALRECRTPSDVVVTTPEEIARRGNLVGPVLRPALRHGKLVYDARRGASAWPARSMAGYPPAPKGGPVTDEERLAETRRWLRQGEEDLRVAEMAAQGEDVATHVACYLSQQAAEKALKAVLVFLQIEFEKTHKLDELRDLVPSDWPVRQEHPNLEALSQWAVKARYPGNWPDPTEADAQAALRQARAVWESVVRDLAEHGFGAQEQGEA